MDRRRFLGRVGLLTAGGVAGASAGLAAEQVLRADGAPSRARGVRGDGDVSCLRVADHDGFIVRIAARTAQIPKLIVRVRFPSPAPTAKAQVRGIIPGLDLDVAGLALMPQPPATLSRRW